MSLEEAASPLGRFEAKRNNKYPAISKTILACNTLGSPYSWMQRMLESRGVLPNVEDGAESSIQGRYRTAKNTVVTTRAESKRTCSLLSLRFPAR